MPLGCSSDMALYLMDTALPRASSTSISSSSSSGVRKLRVGTISVYLLYWPSHALVLVKHLRGQLDFQQKHTSGLHRYVGMHAVIDHRAILHAGQGQLHCQLATSNTA